MKWFFTSAILIACEALVIPNESQYIVSFEDFKFNVTTKNIIDMDWELTRPARGVVALSGFLDIKEEINTENVVTWLNIYYSKTGDSFTLTPYRMPKTSGTRQLNFLYKDYLKDGLMECCENPVEFDEVFVPPLRKGRTVCTECIATSNNYPSHLRLGYYLFDAVIEGEVEFCVKMILKLEMEE